MALSYVWEFGDGGTSISPSPTHTFADYQAYPVSLIVTNGACSDTLTQEIKLINEVPDFITIKDSACKSDTISFKATNINEDNISNYIWDFGDGTSDTSKFIRTVHKYDSAGIFTVKLTVTDIHGCNESVTKTSTIHILSPKADFITNAQGVCSKKDIIFTDKSTTADGNNSIVGWQWKFGDGQTSNFTNPPPASVPHSYLIDGLYFPKLIVTDVLGCQDSVTNTIPLIVTNPIAAFTADKIVTCNKDTIAFKNTSSGNKLAYQWDFNDGSTSTDSIPKKYYTANGLYNVTLTVTDLYGCSNTVTRDSYIDVKEVTAGFTTSATRGSCLPFEVKFTDTSLNESFIFWRYGDGSSSEFANPNHKYVTSDTFNVRLVAYRGERGTKCTDTAYIDIIVKAPIATLTYSPLEGCAPLGVTFNITSDIPLLYTWDFGDGNISAAETTTTDTTHVYSYPQSYTPSVLIRDPLDQSKCKIPIIGKDVIKLYSSLVNFAVKDTTLVCDNGNVAFKNLTISGSPVASYSWDFGDGSPASPDKEPVHFYNVEGFYDVTLIIKTVFGCTDFLTKKSYIRVAKKPAIAIGGITEYCGLSPVTLQGTVVSSDATSITWSWNFGNGNTSPLQNPPAQDYPAIGNYPVNLIAKSNSGCSDTATVNINIHPIPTVSAGSDTTVCLGSTAALQATGADDYTWQPASNLSCTICSNPIANPTDSITYTVTGATVFGCTYTDEIFIDVKKPFTLTGLQAQDSICLGKSIQLNVVGAELYSWSPSTGLNSTTTPIVVAAPVVSTTYKVIGSDNKNCFTDSATIDLKVNPNPTVNAGEDKLLHLGNSVPLVIQYSTDVINWLWSPATGLSCSNCPAPIATPESSTTYSITVANNSKCTATDQVFIKVVCDNSNLFLPTAFTPNNDGLNDWFYPMGVGLFKIQSLRIFNRYGQVVFLKANFNPNDRSAGWDGKYKGKNSDLGAYIYTLEVICKNGEVLTINGKILLIQ